VKLWEAVGLGSRSIIITQGGPINTVLFVISSSLKETNIRCTVLNNMSF